MKKLTLSLLLAISLFGFYTDVASEYNQRSNDGYDDSDSGEIGYRSESNYGWQRGRGI